MKKVLEGDLHSIIAGLRTAGFSDANIKKAIPELVTNGKIKVTKKRDLVHDLYLHDFAKAWIDQAVGVGVTDREKAAKGFVMAYAAIGLDPPEVVWLTSPLSGAIAAAKLTSEKPIVERLFLKPLEEINKEISKKLSSTDLDFYNDCLLHRISDVTAPMVTSLSDELIERAGALRMEGAEKVVQNLILEAMYGSMDASHLGAFDYLYRSQKIHECGKAQGLIRLAPYIGWYWPFEKQVIATELPTEILVDENKKLHAVDKMALSYADGFGVHVWHGVRVPPRAITTSNSIDWKDIEKTADRDLQNALAEIKALKWAKSDAVDEKEMEERFEAAEAVKMLGGIESVRGLTEGEK